MLHSVRLVTFGYWGVPFPPAVSWNLEAAPSLVQARQAYARVAGRPDVYNPVQGIGVVDPEWQKNWDGKGENDRLPGVALDWRVVYPSSLNTTLPTSEDSDTSKFLEKLSNPFGGKLPGLAYTRNTTETFAWLAGDQPNLGANTGWAVRAYLHRPPGEQKAPTWCRVWGDVGAGTGWAVRVVKGRASVSRLTRNWSQEQERQLWAAREIEEDDDASAGERDAARATRRAVEERINSYEKGLDHEGELYGRPFDVVILPEGAGFSVFLNGKRTALKLAEMENLPVTDEETTTLPTLWDAGPIITGTSSAFFWQNGYPEFAATGELRLGSLLGTYETSADLPVGDIAPRLNAYIPGGTSVQISKRYAKDSQGNDTKRVEIVAELSTSDRRRSPVLYRVNLVLRGGPRDGKRDVTFDTGAHELRDIMSDPVLEVVPQFEGEGRRRQYQVFIRMKSGGKATLDHTIFPGLNAGNAHYSVLENRTCTLYIDGVAVMSNGLIKEARLVDPNSMAALPGATALTEVLMRGETVLQLTICDGYALCEERRTRDEVGDGYYRGEYLRLVLGNVGFPEAELAGIAPLAGGRLKPIQPGDKWVVRPRRGQNYAEWLRAFMKKYCPGWVLYQDRAGVWQFKPRSRAIVATFTSRADTNRSNTYPGRWAILRRLELTRDVENFFNVHTLYGAQGSDGEPLSRVWRIEESIKWIEGTPQAKSHIGRIREAEPIEDDAIGSEAEANKMLRLNVQEQGLGRFGGFGTYYHSEGIGGKDLFPGDFIIGDGLVQKIVRIPDGSLRDDRMSLGTQEMN